MLDDDATVAAADLVGRTGATQFKIGYLHDDVPPEEAGWYAHAQYRGARITVEDQPGPAEAADALARRLLTGAKCYHCGGLVTLSDDSAFAFHRARTVDGVRWDIEQSAAAGWCRWRRIGNRWEGGCENRKPTGPSKFPRRQPKRRTRRERRR